MEDEKPKNEESFRASDDKKVVSDGNKDPGVPRPMDRPDHIGQPGPKKEVKINTWKILSVILAIAVVFLLVKPTTTGLAILGGGDQDTGDKVVEYLNALTNGQTAVELKEVTRENGLEKVIVTIEGFGDVDFYVSPDKKLLLSGQPLEVPEDLPPIDDTTPTPQDVPKSDVPVVEAFVMSHCPFGTQIEKGLLPVAKALGDQIDFNIRFVYYAMHPSQGEVEEQLNQYCIQEEQSDKFLDYLECFLTDGDGERCLTETGIDTAALTACTEAADTEFSVTANLEDTAGWLSGKFPLFDVHKDLNELYGIQGSPTLVINGVVVSSARDSASLLGVICNAFNVAPEECALEFDSATPSSGFGWDQASSDNLAACGA